MEGRRLRHSVLDIVNRITGARENNPAELIAKLEAAMKLNKEGRRFGQPGGNDVTSEGNGEPGPTKEGRPLEYTRDKKNTPHTTSYMNMTVLYQF